MRNHNTYIKMLKIASIYAREVMHIENPTVALLNIGTEDEKEQIYKKRSICPYFSGPID